MPLSTVITNLPFLKIEGIIRGKTVTISGIVKANPIPVPIAIPAL